MSRVKVFFVTLLIAVCASAVWAAPPKQVRPIREGGLTREQAIQIAADFCQKMDAPASIANAKAEYYDPALDGDAWDDSSNTRWKIEFPGVFVEVLDSSGIVYYFRNDVYQDQREAARQFVTSTISEQDALNKSAQFMDLWQPTSSAQELQPPRTQLLGMQEEAISGSVSWGIWRYRQFHDIPYRDQSAYVEIDAETGHLLEIHRMLEPTVSGSLNIQVTQEQALNIGRAFLANTDSPNAPFDSVKTEVIEPNHFWQGDLHETPIPGLIRVAYTVRYLLGDGADKLYNCEVWVDAEDGSILGGTYCGGTRGAGAKGAHHPPKLRHKFAGRKPAVAHAHRRKPDAGKASKPGEKKL